MLEQLHLTRGIGDADGHCNICVIMPLSMVIPIKADWHPATFVWVKVSDGDRKASSPMENHFFIQHTTCSALSKGYSAIANKSMSST
jgi:hypothetical protein